LNYPFAVFAATLLLLWLVAIAGSKLEVRRPLTDDQRSDFDVVVAAALTLLGLIIGFSFSMATGRYDMRKNYEEAEANAIGTEYVRADLLPEAERTEVKRLLRQYTDLRIQLYRTHYSNDATQIRTKTAQVQDQMWAAVVRGAGAQPTPVMALVMSGMNDVLNSQGYTQAAWWNRIPLGAWCLMIGIAVFCNLLLGFGTRGFNPRFLLVLPLIVAVSFFLIADIDSPRGGIIRVAPQNLESLQGSLK
jgi:hypothetical protein